MCRTLLKCLLAALACLAITHSLSAAPIYSFQFADLGGPARTSFTIDGIGGTQEVAVYLVEEPAAPGDPDPILHAQGLASVSLMVRFDAPTGIAAVVSDADIHPNASFDPFSFFPAPQVTAGDAGFTAAVDLLGPNLFPDADHRILLGTFRFTALGLGTVTITATDRDPLADDTIGGDPLVMPPMILDGIIPNSTATITVQQSSATPAPAGLVLAGVGGFGLLGYAWQRRRRLGK